tara:strand:- start:16556 stop:16780 length:225 start_codon:yes stop_codon:yes gene_type:complete
LKLLTILFFSNIFLSSERFLISCVIFNTIFSRIFVDNLLDEDPPFFSDSFANDFDPSYRTWGSQQWYVRASSKF